jgi:PAS domain S-box-containing protein
MEHDFWAWLASQKEHLALIAGTMGALAVIWKFLGIRIINFAEGIIYMFNAKEANETIERKLDDIMLQLVPNGGSSIKDSLNRIEDTQHFLGSFMKTQLHSHNKALFETNELGDVIWVNRPHSRLTGFQLTEMLGAGWINLIAPECRTGVLDKWNRAIAKGREFDESLWYIKTDNVTRYLVRVHAYPIHHRDGKTAGYLGDVTPLGAKQLGPVNCEQFRGLDKQAV